MIQCILYDIHKVLLWLYFLMATPWYLVSGNTCLIYHYSFWLVYQECGYEVSQRRCNEHYCGVTWAHWCLKLPVTHVCVQRLVWASKKRNSKFSHYWPLLLVREFTGHHGDLVCVGVFVSLCLRVSALFTVHSLMMSSQLLLRRALRSDCTPQENGAKYNYNT